MDRLLQPDTGLIIWTIVTFLTLVFLLKRFAWKPLIEAIEQREAKIKEERETAEKARAEAQKLKAEFESHLAQIDAKAKEVMAAAAKEAEALRARHTAEAQEEAKRLLDKTRAELEEEKRRLTAQLRQDVAQLAVSAAEKLVHKSIDDGVRKGALDQFFKDLDHAGGAR